MNQINQTSQQPQEPVAPKVGPVAGTDLMPLSEDPATVARRGLEQRFGKPMPSPKPASTETRTAGIGSAHDSSVVEKARATPLGQMHERIGKLLRDTGVTEAPSTPTTDPSHSAPLRATFMPAPRKPPEGHQ